MFVKIHCFPLALCRFLITDSNGSDSSYGSPSKNISDALSCFEMISSDFYNKLKDYMKLQLIIMNVKLINKK